MSHDVSPLATPFPALPAIAGATPHIVRAGYKDWGRCDLTYVELAEGTSVAGVFTRNICCSSEVDLGRANIGQGLARALVVNAGNSNAFTGYRGREAVEQIMDQVAAHLGAPREQVFVSSTGVIGVPLPKDKARDGVTAALASPECGWEDAARTIGTTDTFPKGATATAIVGDKTVTLSAIIKGSGMIAPDMATMLGYIFTDCAIAPAYLQELLGVAADETFNSITVDSDTSTSDTILAFATGGGAGLHHSSWDMGGIEQIGLGAMHMADSGYARGWGLGRHVLGSNYFHYIRDPWGSYAEYSADIDYIPVTQDWEAKTWEAHNAFYLWGPTPPEDFVTNFEVQ